MLAQFTGTMPDAEYFAYPALSNSKMSEIKKQITGKSDFFDPADAFRFGSLIDAMITEGHRIEWAMKLLDDQPIMPTEFETSRKMRKAFLADRSCCDLVFSNNVEYQKVFIRELDMQHYAGVAGGGEPVSFTVLCKCKFDFYGAVSGDIKSTTAKTEKEFIAACYRFDYFRSRAFYMDIAGTDLDVIIGISKHNFKIFKLVIKRGDKYHSEGVKQYQELAFHYWVING